MMNCLKVSRNKLQLKMAEKLMNPCDLCRAAGISYASYRRLIRMNSCRIATLGKLAAALKCDVLDIVE